MTSESMVNDTKRVKLLIIQILKDLVMSARGRLVTFRPAKVAQDISTLTKKSPRSESVIVRNFLEELVELGLVKVIKRSARGKVYGITRDSEFWNILERYNANEIMSYIDACKASKRASTYVARELAST